MEKYLKTKPYPRMLDVNRKPGQPKKRKKITLIFDEKKRREFLVGFHKRKVQRKEKAHEELQQKLKEERKRVKKEAKEQYKKLLSNRDVPELEQLLFEREYETAGHRVSILELKLGDLAEGSKWIGENKVESESEDEQSESDHEKEENEEVVGMSLNDKQVNKTLEDKLPKSIKSMKNIKHAIQQTTIKKLKKSKVFQRKRKFDRQKNKHENKRKMKLKQKTLQEHKKKFKGRKKQ